MTTNNVSGTRRVRIPPFTPEDPDLWFRQVEWHLEDAGYTTSEEKFKAVSMTLEPPYSQEVRDVILNPPAEDPFKKLKDELVHRICKSQEQKTRLLLEQEAIGDRSPSQFLRHLQQLAPSRSDNIIRTLWMSGLNPILQATLAAQPKMEVDALARIADRIMDTMVQHETCVAAVSTPPIPNKRAHSWDQLRSPDCNIRYSC